STHSSLSLNPICLRGTLVEFSLIDWRLTQTVVNSLSLFINSSNWSGPFHVKCSSFLEISFVILQPFVFMLVLFPGIKYNSYAPPSLKSTTVSGANHSDTRSEIVQAYQTKSKGALIVTSLVI